MKEVRLWIKQHKLVAAMLLTCCLIILFALAAPWLFATHSSSVIFDKNTSFIGDTFGIMNPFIAIAAVIVTFAAFWVQYQANQSILKENKKQQIIARFYEMLKIHRENVKEFEWLQNVYTSKDSKPAIQTIPNEELIEKSGRQIFDYHLTEFNLIYNILDIIAPDLKKKEKIRRAYNIFFCGSHDKYLNQGMRNDLYLSLAETNKKNFTSKIKSILVNSKDSPKKDHIIETLFHYRKFFLSQAPFYGHLDKLGNYYRHLFLTVKTVANEDEKYLPYNEKRDLLRILRAQLSSNEQIMLFFNWYSGSGSQWEEDSDEGNHFFTKYRMIHNIIPQLMSPFHEFNEDYKKAYTRFTRYFAHCKHIQDFGTKANPIFEFEEDDDIPKFEYRH